MQSKFDIIVVGGGAAGFFTAINCCELFPGLKVAILERGKEVLNKVKISGGGRCNVTHAQFIPDELVRNYPRGEKELLGPFHNFMTGDTVAWFENRGVALKTEADGRMFPVTDSSQTIIDCFLNEIDRLGISLFKGEGVKDISQAGSGWHVRTNTSEFTADFLVVATGSSTIIWNLLGEMGHSIVPGVPSLFTFNIKDERINELPGISVDVSVQVLSAEGKTLLESEGPLLITHWGMSGPAILKLSAWGARVLHELDYRFSIRINWLEHQSFEEVLSELKHFKKEYALKGVRSNSVFGHPKRLWQSIVRAAGIPEQLSWADLNKNHLRNLAQLITASRFEVNGKSTFKEEFVTAGGVDLKEVNFKTFESKKAQGLYFAGEVLNIDAITGGFNFQNAWTGGFMVAKAITDKLKNG